MSFSHLPLIHACVVLLMLYLILFKRPFLLRVIIFALAKEIIDFFFIGKTEQQGNPAAVFPLFQANGIIAVLQCNLVLPIYCLPHFACNCHSFGYRSSKSSIQNPAAIMVRQGSRLQQNLKLGVKMDLNLHTELVYRWGKHHCWNQVLVYSNQK